MKKVFFNLMPAGLAAACLSVLLSCEDSTFYIEGWDGDTALEVIEDSQPDILNDDLSDTVPDSDTAADVDEPEDVPPDDPCDGIDCGGNGTCVITDGSPECLCNHGYLPEGLNCVPDPCADVTCGVNAHCEDGSCACDEGFEGDPYAGCTSIVTDEARVRSQLAEIAMAELGLCEGVDDRPYMLDQPGFWCYEFVAWVYNQADYPLPSSRSLPEYYVGSLPPDWRPEPGDLIKFTIQHYGMVAELSADGTRITTIEGNYSSCVHSRSITDASVEYYGSLNSVFE